MLDTYANSSGHIRLGTLLMDLDALSGVIAYKHSGNSVTIVTAAVDRIIIKHPLKEICDLELSGQVTFATGRSSMEISLQVAKAPPENHKPKEEDVLMTCTFTMVSLDPSTKKPVPIAPLKLETESERELFKKGEENYNAKKKMSKSRIRDYKPDDEESGLIHEMWKKQIAYLDASDPAEKPSNVLPMNRTIIHSTQIMQPQYRNRHNFMIFGGFLLKQTFELAFTCAASFSHTRPTFLSLDPSTFENPVPVGSVLYITASVNYTDPSPAEQDGETPAKGTRVQVTVVTKTRNVEHEERKPTGTFHYTFLVDKDVRVMPETYSEFMRWVDGRRRALALATSLASERSTYVEGITE